ncbi:MAG TPA: hypothetical protein VIE15_03165 [Acidimicrobiales bacterium]|jgi:hypothetical protein
MTYDETTHAHLRAQVADQALGILDGRGRAELLAHVEQCPECADELESLTAAADALVRLAPGHEPPVGFESRAVDQMRAASPGHARRRAPLLAAVAASVLVAFGLGWTAHVASSRPTTRVAAGQVAERDLAGSGHTVGAAYVYTGSPSWMFITVSLPGAPSAVRCTVVTTSGHRHVVGTFALASGRGVWGAPLPVSFTSVRSIELATANGTVVARLANGAWSDASGGSPRAGAIHPSA